jgi:GT2 family glycosyltransferase
MSKHRREARRDTRSFKYARIDVFVINYNGVRYLKKCLPSLMKMSWPNFKVYVADNGSTDGSVNFVRRNYPSVGVIQVKENIGFSRISNLAIRQSKADFVCLLNNDMEVSPDWMTILMENFLAPKVAVAVPKMYDFHGRVNSAGGVCDFYGFAYNRGIGEIDHGQYDQAGYVAYGCLGAALIKRSVFDEIGYLDETYILYHEDVDFSWRLILRGYKIAYNPRSVVYHHHMGTSLATGRSTIIGWWERNRFRTLLKNYRIRTLVTIFPTLAILKMLHLGYAVVINRDAREVRAVLTAYVWNLIHIKDTIRERRRIQKSGRVDELKLMRLLIPWSIELRLGLGKIYHPIARRGPGFMLSHP